MDKDGATSLGTVTATVVAGSAAETAFHALGIIVMGAFGGAIFALMKLPKTSLSSGVRIATPRMLMSLFCSWVLEELLQGFLDGYHYSLSRTALLMFVSFAVAANRELFAEVQPLIKPISAFLARRKE